MRASVGAWLAVAAAAARSFDGAIDHAGREQVAIEDNTFSLTVTHRGAEDHEAEAVRELVSALIAEEYPMLRLEEERTQLHVRPDPGWNRARMVEWIVSQTVESVENKLGFRGVMPIYLGEDPAFRHIAAVGGLDILITGGPAIDSFFLRSAMQVDELLRNGLLRDVRPPEADEVAPLRGSRGREGRIGTPLPLARW